MSTFSLKNFARDRSEYKMGNYAVFLGYDFPLENNFENAVKKIQAIFKSLVGAHKLIAFKMMV